MTRFLALALLVGTFASPLAAQQADLRDEAARALKKAATYYREKVASHGGYVYYYSLDLKDRWGEGKFTADTIFVEPPGTPTVGLAYLKAYAATGERYYLDAAREAALALVYGQLQSGGWTQVIHFAPMAKRVGKYRNGKGGNWNASSLDDGQTQAALEMLMRMDQALDRKDKVIHEAVTYGLAALLKAQFANGAFPQIWTGPVPAKPVVKARLPKGDWKTEGKVKNYWDHYTLNDNLAGSIARTLIVAHQVYEDDKYKKALMKLGDFLILAQMPEPQPAWCQQYDFDMQPMWARKFEPPAITGHESQDVMRTLLLIARHTGEKKYLDPIPAALKYFDKSLLKDGRVARFYELGTNKPLYMDGKYQLTYDDSAAPGHYGWKQPARFDQIEKEYRDAKDGKAVKESVSKPSDAAVKKILAELDKEGRWITVHKDERLTGQPKFRAGFEYISSAVFSRHVETLSRYLAEKK